jgi:hypothetical protein
MLTVLSVIYGDVADRLHIPESSNTRHIWQHCVLSKNQCAFLRLKTQFLKEAKHFFVNITARFSKIKKNRCVNNL